MITHFLETSHILDASKRLSLSLPILINREVNKTGIDLCGKDRVNAICSPNGICTKCLSKQIEPISPSCCYNVLSGLKCKMDTDVYRDKLSLH